MNSLGDIVFSMVVPANRWAMRLAGAFVVATVCFLGAPPSMADTWDDAVAAHLTGDNAKAFRLALQLAQDGDARAQGFVGFLYSQGLGVEKDRDQAMKWYRLAAEQGDAGAQTNLCLAFSSGDPANLDLDQALYWCRLSASQGDDGGLFFLGVFYYLGRGVERNMLEAYVWLSFAELVARSPKVRSEATKLKVEARKSLTVEEIVEADRRISSWKSDRP